MATRVDTWTERLIKNAVAGTVLDLSRDDDEAWSPSIGRRWSPSRRIPARSVVAALTSATAQFHHNGLRVRGALLEGKLDLSFAVLKSGISFEYCEFNDSVDVSDAVLPRLVLLGVRARGIRADNSKLTGRLQLTSSFLCSDESASGPVLSFDAADIGGDVMLNHGFSALGEVSAVGAFIGGRLNLRGATLSNPAHVSLNIDRADVQGGAIFNGKFSSTGEIRALGARFGGQVSFDNATLSNAGERTLSLDGIEVRGDLFLDDGFSSAGTVRALGAEIMGQMSFKGAKLSNAGGTALSLDRIKIGAGLLMSDGFSAVGEVRALGSVIGGQLNVTGAKLSNPDGHTLSMDGTKIGGDAYLDRGFVSDGEVRAPGATIGGQLSLAGAKLTNPAGTALTLDHSEIAESVFLDEQFTVSGQVRMVGIKVKGFVTFSGATLASDTKSCLVLDNARIDGELLLNEGFSATGEVRGLGMTVGDQIRAGGAKFSNPTGIALVLDRTSVGGDVHLTQGFSADGQVRASDCAIKGQLIITRATLRANDRPALLLDGAKVASGAMFAATIHGSASVVHATFGGRLAWGVSNLKEPESVPLEVNAIGSSYEYLDLQLMESATARFNLARANIARLSVRRTSGLNLEDAAGWSVGTVQGELLTNPASAVTLLRTISASTSGTFVVQPWKELAAAIERGGEPEHARTVRWTAARLTTKHSWWLPRWTTRRLYSYTVGYGYYPLLTLAWIVGLWALVAGISVLFTSDFVPTDWRLLQSIAEDPKISPSPLASYPVFNPWLFALDTSLPVSSMGQAAAWRLDDHPLYNALFAGVKAASWALTALLVAGITGVLRKD